MYKSTARTRVSLSLSMLVACATLAFGCDDKSVGDYKEGRRDLPWNWRSPCGNRRRIRRVHRWLQRPGRRSRRNRRNRRRPGRDRRRSRRIHRWLQRPGGCLRNWRCPGRHRRGSRRLRPTWHRWDSRRFHGGHQRPGGRLRNWRSLSGHRRGSRRLRDRWCPERFGDRNKGNRWLRRRGVSSLFLLSAAARTCGYIAGHFQRDRHRRSQFPPMRGVWAATIYGGGTRGSGPVGSG